MKKNSASVFVPGLQSETLHDEVVVLVPGKNQAIKLSGSTAELFRALQQGQTMPSSGPAVRELSEAGILAGSAGFSRRALVTAAGVAAGAGLVALSMPTAALAASSGVTLLSGSWSWGFVSGTSNYYRAFSISWPSGTGPSGVSGSAEPSDLTVDSGVGVVDFGDTESSTSVWETSPAPKSAPLDGNLIGDFTFDAQSYRATFTFNPGG